VVLEAAQRKTLGFMNNASLNLRTLPCAVFFALHNDSAKLHFFAVIALFIFFVGIHIDPQNLYSNRTPGVINFSTVA
jgi:hypothetical protein